jgi:hypothetical protein
MIKYIYWLRDRNITKETSFPSEWFGEFRNARWIVLHLNDSRRLYGWAKEWPSNAKKGHFVITYPTWLVGDGQEIAITGVKNIMINANDVKWVEFVESLQEKKND